MAIPTISLAMIVKNERKNLPRLFESVRGCFDEIHITDTGSTDGTIEWLKECGSVTAECEVFVHHFSWVNSFAQARNYSFSHCKTDYIMWMDGDDALSNREGFINWRNNVMQFSDVYFATYNYALDSQNKPVISFLRERVFRRSINPTWKYDLHEGVQTPPGCSVDYATAWTIDHHRDAADIAADKSRNLDILKKMEEAGQLDSRMQFYYGKELYEQGHPVLAIKYFDMAIAAREIEFHDKLLAYQYASYSAAASADQLHPDLGDKKVELYNQALNYCIDGFKLDPNRAELHTSAGDVCLKLGDLIRAIPFYAAAKKCFNKKQNGSPYEGAIYSFVDSYGLNPTLQLAKIYFNLGKLDDAKAEAQEAILKYDSKEASDIMLQILRMEELTRIDNNQAEVEDIVFTCPPQGAYEFDEELYKSKGMGGSETALIEMARELKMLTGRPVKVFAPRKEHLVCESGVEYIPNLHLNEYFSKFKPRIHIAWRHNIEITRAKTYLWCHDLITPSVEVKQNFYKIMCLTPFHRDYVMGKQGVTKDKIWITRNGINPEKFRKVKLNGKNPNKLVWMSSPDRGLERAMHVCDEVKKQHPDIELHVYYGLENLYKYGLGDLADRLKSMMAERPYVKYHGFTEQNKMYQEVSDAVCWVHPCNFIETSCITAMEMLALGVYPVTRALGALKDTLGTAAKRGHASLLDHDCVTEREIKIYADEVSSVLKNTKWENVVFDLGRHSWNAIAHEWVEEFGIEHH